MLNGEMSAADLAAVVGNGNDGFGGNGNAWWILILFILFGWNNGGWANNGNGSYSEVQRGFDQNAVMSGIQNLQNAVSNGFATAEVSQCNQTANLTGQLSALALNQATNACRTDSNIADLKYTVATEACADRQSVTDALQAVINAINNGVQGVKDQLNAQTLEAKNEEIANLRTQINLSNLAASQNQQTAQLMADNAAQTAALIQRINPTAVPAYVVPNPNSYGYSCGCNNGCGCGM